MTKNLPSARTSEILVQEAGNELLIYDLNINKAFCLNETSAMVWQLCDGANSIADIVGFLSRRLKMNVPEELVWLALDGLKKDKLLEQSAEFEVDFGGLNRRQVIRKVGFASLVALPIIASVVAPSALMAQSGGCASAVVCDGNCCSPGSMCSLSGCCPAGSEVCSSGVFGMLGSCCPSPGVCLGGFFGASCCLPSMTCLISGSVARCCGENQVCTPFGCMNT